MTLAQHARQATQERLRAMHPEIELMEWLEALPAGEAKEIRCDAGWTQKEVADHCGISSASMVGQWETQQTGWSRHSGLRYARLLKQHEAELAHERTPL